MVAEKFHQDEKANNRRSRNRLENVASRVQNSTKSRAMQHMTERTEIVTLRAMKTRLEQKIKVKLLANLNDLVD